MNNQWRLLVAFEDWTIGGPGDKILTTFDEQSVEASQQLQWGTKDEQSVEAFGGVLGRGVRWAFGTFGLFLRMRFRYQSFYIGDRDKVLMKHDYYVSSFSF